MFIKYVEPQEDTLKGFAAIPIHSKAFEKLASNIYIPNKIIKMAAELKPRDDGRYVHLIALGASDAWGQNRRGDAFAEWSLLGSPMPQHVKEVVERHHLPVDDIYGLETFEKNAYMFKEHDNKDPLKAIGERVKCAAYNEKMKRGELIAFAKVACAPDLVAMLDSGQPVDWSMGAKVKFDVCGVCGNIAKTPREYCKHASNMNQLQEDGNISYVENWFPNFFDISWVSVPADRQAHTLSKVASAAFSPSEINMDRIQEIQEKLAQGASIKKAMIRKTIPLDEADSSINDKENNKAKKLLALDSKKERLSPDTIKRLKNAFGAKKVINGLTGAGIVLCPNEVRDLAADENDLPEDVSVPSMDILKHIAPLINKRSMFKSPVIRRVSIQIVSFDKGNGAEDTLDKIKKANLTENKISDYDKNIQGYYTWLKKIASRPAQLLKVINHVNVMDYLDGERAIIKEASEMCNVNLETNNFDVDYIRPFICEVNTYAK